MILFFLFALTAFIFSSVGFGGGSTYTALLVLFDVNYQVIPFISLVCNMIVVCGGVLHFRKNGYLKIKDSLLLIVPSIPMAFLGGSIVVEKFIFVMLLSVFLFAGGVILLTQKQKPFLKENALLLKNKLILLGSVMVLGFVAGITGIGGGIFLAPVLYLMKWGNAKKIAGVCSLFILLNSFSGLLGQFYKYHQVDVWEILHPLLFLPFAVLLFGQAGSFIGSKFLPMVFIKRTTGVIILLVSVRLFTSLFSF